MIDLDLKEIRAGDFFATDGEGYAVMIKSLPANPNDAAWKEFQPHYCDRGYADDAHKEAALEFAGKLARVFDKSRDSHVFFYLQRAFPENADEWEWSQFQELLNKIIAETPGVTIK